MSSLLAAGAVFVQAHQKHGPTTQIVRTAPPVIFYAGLVFIGTVALSYWFAVRQHLAQCECPKPKKWWKR